MRSPERGDLVYMEAMRLLRLTYEGRPRYARWVDEHTARAWSAAPWEGGTETDESIPLASASLLPPTAPSKIVCVGRNYRAHAAELGHEVPAEPLLFLKPPSALLPHGGVVEWPSESERVDYEGEIALVIGRPLRRASEEECARAIAGVTCADDVTARDLQRKDVQFTRGKGFDTFCPCGPWLETEPPPLDALAIETRVGGVVRQRGTSAMMIWSIPALLAFISRVMRLEPGDLVLTGTPEGVGPLSPGDRVEITIEGVGTLAHSIGARGAP
ncbi:MAG TPA: fumarylacetoacetate hydrolase family protein [Sandaracinaceae bacterium]